MIIGLRIQLHDQLSSSWRPKRVGDAVLVRVGRPEVRKVNSINSISCTKDLCPSSKRVNREEQILASPPFCSTQASNGVEEADLHLGRKSALLYLLIHMLISCRNTLTETSRTMVKQLSRQPQPRQADT
jgi:hypothetical protein